MPGRPEDRAGVGTGKTGARGVECGRSGTVGGNGGDGIRTHETLAGLPVFKTGAFDRSATPPVCGSLALRPKAVKKRAEPPG